MAPRNIQVAFRCYGSDWGMHRGHGSRRIDWMIDGINLNKDNVIFVIDSTISKEYRTALKSKYQTYDAYTLTMSNKRWHRFLEYWQPKHFVSYNDFHPRHRERNKIFREHGVQSWFYSHSVNLPKEGYLPWKNLHYDHLVLWNETDAAQFDGPFCQKHILGPLFSSQVPQTVVAVFDSTWEHYPEGCQDKFFADLYEVLDANPGVIMLFKPKHKMPSIWFERPHKNFYTLPEWIEPGLVIACADLTIAIYGASPAIEAHATGRKAFWYDPFNAGDELVHLKFNAPPITPADRFRELLLK